MVESCQFRPNLWLAPLRMDRTPAYLFLSFQELKRWSYCFQWHCTNPSIPITSQSSHYIVNCTASKGHRVIVGFLLDKSWQVTSLHHLLEGPEVGEWRLNLRYLGHLGAAISAFSKGFMIPEAQPQHVLHMRHFGGSGGCGVEHGTVGTFSWPWKWCKMTGAINYICSLQKNKVSHGFPTKISTNLSLDKTAGVGGSCEHADYLLTITNTSMLFFLYRHDYCNHCS